jgi:hypothetical protein
MIRFSLICDNDHQFESWFASNDAFDSLKSRGHLLCDTCGNANVRKSIMAPRLNKTAEVAAKPAPQTDAKSLSTPSNPQETALKELRAKIEASSEDVGLSFAKEARAIHKGNAPDRPIYGEAKPADAISLIEDGIGVMPLPFTPTRKTN